MNLALCRVEHTRLAPPNVSAQAQPVVSFATICTLLQSPRGARTGAEAVPRAVPPPCPD
jgi:hypothetical protein